ncbi:MAG: ribbon-helix-helix protein, CopG family [Hydrococcus sp. SU_1_0]|nr:ribbon-helix-helix protein, CopG family [Hydrococcus sp. SU_1_0]
MNRNKTEKKQTPKQVRIDDLDLEVLSKIADEQDRSVSSLIRIAIKDYIKK